MVFGEPFYDDHLVRNPNDYLYQSNNNSIIGDLKFNLQTAVDNLVNNAKEWYENYKQNVNQYNNQFGNPEPIINLVQPPRPTQNEIIHEELAVKERRIRELEYDRLEKDERIRKLEEKIEKLENNPFLRWWQRATEDSKKERII